MSVDTVEVLDYHVLSKGCQKWSLKRSQCNENLGEFEQWKVDHVNNGECDINFVGSSPALEAEAAVILWQQSGEKHKLRYRYSI
jgi:hypothetical protein